MTSQFVQDEAAEHGLFEVEVHVSEIATGKEKARVP